MRLFNVSILAIIWGSGSDSWSAYDRFVRSCRKHEPSWHERIKTGHKYDVRI